VRLVRYGRAGEEVLLHDARAGEFFAEASLDSPRYHCDAVASESSELLQCPVGADSNLSHRADRILSQGGSRL
jgi:CRP-like cAMP-binding protein